MPSVWNHVNLRPLFVEHQVITKRDVTQPAKGMVEREAVAEGYFVVFKKHPDDTIFIIGEQGESIVAIKNAARIILPLPVYAAPAPEGVNDAIQDRLFSIIESAAERPDMPIVHGDQVKAYLTERLGQRGLVSMIMTAETRAILPAEIGPHVVFPGMAPNIVYGIPKPEFVGHIVEDSTLHGDEPLMDDVNMTPFPAITRAGILALPNVVSVRVKR